MTTRTERTLGVTSELSHADRSLLATVRTHPGYKVLLDVMERVCIQQDTRLINRDVTEPEKIVAEHRKTQAMWQMFEGMQEQVDREVRLYAEFAIPQPEPEFTDEQREQDEILDPTRHYDRTPHTHHYPAS